MPDSRPPVDPREELARLAASLRAELEREAVAGREYVDAPGLPEAVAGIFPQPVTPGKALDSSPSRRSDGADPTPIDGADPIAPTLTRGSVASPPREATVARSSSPSPAVETTQNKKLVKITVEAEPGDYADRMAELGTLGQTASACKLCGLCDTRKQVVFGTGRARTRVMFIGEAPGADEDAQGVPFVGRAGKLLDKIIDAVGFDRDELYIANILKCRPPNNRDPLPGEIEACTPYLEKQVALIQPKIICTLGKFAGQFITGQPKATMGAMRGKIAYYGDIMVLPIYHPAALLRNPNLKKTVWEDVQILRKEYLR